MPLFAQTTIGIQTAPGVNFNNAGVNQDNEVANADAANKLPFAGKIRALSVYFGGATVTVVARFVAWDGFAGNVILSKTPQFVALVSPTPLLKLYTDGIDLIRGNDAQCIIGFWRDKAGNAQWYVTGAGTFFFLTNLGADAAPFVGPGACAGPYICANLQAFAILLGVAGMKQYNMPGAGMWKKRSKR